MNDILRIARYFLTLNPNMTDKKVQKLVYYAYSWYLVFKNEKLFEESPEAWVHGPVFRKLYEEMRYRRNEFCCILPVNNSDIVEFLNKIYEIYGNLSGNELENLTHQETPWQLARSDVKPYQNSNKIISDESIVKYYSN